MENIAWMAWTTPTAIFFVLIAGTLVVMTWLALAYPEAERVGVLRIPTTRGDRLFVSLIAAAVGTCEPGRRRRRVVTPSVSFPVYLFV